VTIIKTPVTMDVYEYMVLPFVELEIRLGTILRERFDSSVDKKYFEKIRDSLEQSNWRSIVNVNTIEYIKPHPDKKKANLKLVTDITNESRTQLFIKENVYNEDFQMTSSPFDVRYSVKQEFNLNSQISTFNKEECVVRNKTRKSFIQDHFKYDLTIVNENIDGVIKAKYEIEIELLVTDETLTWKPQYINDFMECKVYDLVNIVEPLNRDKIKLKLK
jgi:type VI protein secretion system component VasA